MVADDITQQFRSVVSHAQSSSPPSRSKSPFRARSPGRSKGKSKEEEQDAEFLKEAYRIHAHLASLGTLLSSIKKPYLSTAPAPLRRHDRGHANGSAGRGEDNDGLERWKESKHLTDRERDEIDLRGKVILRRCRERVLALEDAERARQKAINPPAASALYSFLPSLAPVDESSMYQPLIAAHRASVIWTLNDMLAKLSGTLGDMQEERVKRRQERSRTLGGQAAREAAVFAGSSTGSKGGGTGSTVADLFGVKKGNGGPDVQGVVPQDEPPIEEQLSQAQLQQFASENNALLEHMESKLDTVLAAEKSLLEISAMQTELVRHLTQQTEITERLYDEAVGSVSEVGRANTQLRQARKRGEEGRLFLLVFLLGASFALLFLDWYK